MTRTTTVVIAALTGASLIGLSLFARRGRIAGAVHGQASDEGDNEREIERLTAQLSALGVQVSSLKNTRPKSQPPGASEIVAAPAEAPKAPKSYTAEERKRIIAEDDARRRKYMDEVEKKFHLEQKDGAWAPSAETSIRAVATSTAKSTEKTIAIAETDCRTDTCRVEVKNDDDAIREWFPPFGLAAQNGFGNILVDQGVDQAGRPLSILYMSRRRPVEN